MKTNLSNWLSGYCLILLIVVLAFQLQQQRRLNALQRQQESLPAAVNQQLQQQYGWAAGLANQVTNLGQSLETLASQQQSRFGALQQQQESLSSSTSQQLQQQHDWAAGLANQVTNLSRSVETLAAQQQSQFGALHRQQESLSSSMNQQRQQQHDWAVGLANQVTNLGQNLETRLGQSEQQAKIQQEAIDNLSSHILALDMNWQADWTQHLNAKADEVVSAFSNRLDQKGMEAAAQVTNLIRSLNSKSEEIIAGFSARLNEKATAAATQVAKEIRLQAEAALAAKTIERSNKTARLLAAADRYEKASRPELAEFCYLSALKCSEGNAGLVLKPFLAWQERNFAGLSENGVLTSGTAKLMALYEALDKALPESIASPDEMELTLSVVEKIRAAVIERQQKKIAEIRKVLSWDQFDVTHRPIYEQTKETLASFAPMDQILEEEKNELLQTVDNLIRTATALSADSVMNLLPPSPKAPLQVLTNWLARSLELVDSSTDTTEAKLAGLSVLMDFVRQQPEAGGYAEVLTNKSVLLGCEQWAERARAYEELSDKLDKPDTDTISLGQSLLNQGFSMLKTFTDKSLTVAIAAGLPGLASKLASQRELLLVGQGRLVDDPSAFSSKEQAMRARSLLYGQILSSIFDLRSMQGELVETCGASPSQVKTLKNIEERFRDYLAAYEKDDEADMVDAKADQILKERQRRQRYADHCRQKIEDAQSNYNAAKKIADEGLFSRWSNARAQEKLWYGLEYLYSIDVNDLNHADPGLAAKWNEVEELLKKKYEINPKPSDINAKTRKKSLADF